MAVFPDGFLWGTSQSGHSIEGGNFASDWWRWEQRPGRIAGRATSEDGAEFLANYRRIFDFARDFGQNAFLFSLEWSRIQPKPGEFDEAAIETYRGVFEVLQRQSIEPVCVLQHVTLPRWFAQDFGWHHREAPEKFRVYAERVVGEFAPFCRWWAPVREPMHWVTMACLERRWPGPKRGPSCAAACLRNMARAHADTYRIVHAAREDALVGAAIHARRFFPADPNSPWDVRTQLRESRRCNHVFLDAVTAGTWPWSGARDSSIANTIDFIGIAYYGREHVRFALTRPDRLCARLCDAEGRAIVGPVYEPDPDGLVDVLRELNAYGKPMIVSANGLGTEDDVERCRYIVAHSEVLRRVRKEGLDLRGYFHRTLLDGFEWDLGYSKPFGLVHVDRAKHTRTAKPSATLYRELCRSGTISPGVIARHCPEAAREKEPATA